MSNLEEHLAEQDHITAEFEGNAPEIRKVLCLSTIHISRETAKALDEFFNDGFGLMPPIGIGGQYGDAGWFLYVPAKEDEYFHTPDDLRVVFAHARTLDCKNVLIDMDAEEVDGLPVHEWEVV